MRRSLFSLSHYKLLTMNFGNLVPVGLMEVLPGDTFRHSLSALVRASPLVKPVMHPTHITFHSWFVPMRLVWEDWEDFITGGPDGDDASVLPLITFGGGSGAAEGSLADYLGVTPGVNNLAVNALPFRAYALIWNEWYRDQDLETELVIDITSGPDSTTNTTLQNVSWQKDYFTTSRLDTQKGTAVPLPLGSTAPVLGVGTSDVPSYATGNIRESDGVQSSKSVSTAARIVQNGATGYPNVYADLTQATGTDVIQFREAMALQRFMENRARYGSRYTEYLRQAFGVMSSDARLQRPEYLGGGKQTITFSEILQTGPDTSDDGVGNLFGHGIGAMRSNRYKRFFEEHGYIITLANIKPTTMYVQGLRRLWNRRNKEDFFTRELQHIGQQPVLNKEVYAAHSTPDGTFSYQDKYDDYRRMESSVHGEFRTTENDWHLGRIFGSDPALNASFVKSDPANRIFATTTVDQFQLMINHSVQARRLVAATGKSFIF